MERFICLEYTVSEDNYVSLLSGLIRQKDRRPLGMVSFLLLTVGQAMVIAWLCLTRVREGQWTFFAAWSVLVFSFAVLRRCTVKARARGTLYRLKTGGQLTPDFWLPHRLTEKKDGLHLSYGGAELLCPHGGLDCFEEKESLIFLYAGTGIFDIVPISVFPTDEAKRAFLSRIDDFRAIPADAAEPADLDNEAVLLTLLFEEDAFLRSQVSAYRSVYIRYQLSKPDAFIKLAVSIFLLVYAANRPVAVNIALALSLCLFLNRQHLLALTPLASLRIRRELGGWEYCREATLIAGESGIRMEGNTECVQIPYKQINLSEDVRVGRVFSWGRLPAILIPKTYQDSDDYKAFVDYVADRRSAL